MSASGAPCIVIGGGFVGVCSALQLQRLGREVVVVDPGEPERAASFGNAGQFALGEVVPLSGPGVLHAVPRWLTDPLGPLAIRWRYLPRLAPWLLRFLRAGRMDRVRAISRAMTALGDRMHRDYQPLIKAASAQHLVRPGPHLRLYDCRQDWEGEGWRWQLRAESGLRYEALDHAALYALEPALADSVGFGIASPDRSSVSDPRKLLEAFLALFQAGGGRVVTGMATGFRHHADQVTAVELADGTVLPASKVVLAAGAWSHRLATLLGDRVPLETERGYHVMLPHHGTVLRHSLSHVARGFALSPMEGGLRLAGTVEFAGLEAPPNWQRAHRLIEVARKLLPGLNVAEPRFWMGHRPSLPDSLPVIDRASRARNVLYAFGHGHMGLSWGATTGRLVADLAMETASSFDMEPFRLARFG